VWTTRTVAMAQSQPVIEAPPVTKPGRRARPVTAAPALPADTGLIPVAWSQVAAAEPEAGASAAASAPTPAPQAAPSHAPTVFRVPPSARLHYHVVAQARGFALEGEGELDWRHDAKTYDAQLTLSAPLLPRRSQRSEGQVTAEGLAPTRFS